MKAYSYVRFSTPGQIKSDSLRRQIEFSEQYAKKNNLVLDDTLRVDDLGISAFRGKHRSIGALGKFMELVRTKQISKGSILIVESFDRLSREEIIEALSQFLDIIKAGIKVITLSDGMEYTRETINQRYGDLQFGINIMARANEESKIKSQRLSAAWENKRRQAITGTKKLTARCPSWLELNKDKTGFTIIESIAKIVRQIFSMKLDGVGKTAIVRKLNSTPEVTKNSGWRESYIGKTLRNPAVIGEYQPHKLVNGKRQPVGDIIQNYYPTIIYKDVFYRVQQQFSQNINKGGQTGKASNLFVHIIRCGYCGGSMAFVNKGAVYLTCDTARRGMDCCHSSIRYDELKKLVLEYCQGLRPQDLLKNNSDTDLNQKLLNDELEGATGELSAVNKEINNLTDSVSTTPDKRVRAVLEKRMTEKFDKQALLKKNINRLEQQADVLSRAFENTKITLDNIKELLAFIDNPENTEGRIKLRSELRKLITRIDVYPEGTPRLNSKNVKRAIEAVSHSTRGYRSPDKLALLTAEFQERAENPKVFRFFTIYFTSGNVRKIYPQAKQQLAIDYDSKTGMIGIDGKRFKYRESIKSDILL